MPGLRRVVVGSGARALRSCLSATSAGEWGRFEMAGDWIKFRKSLVRDPRVIIVSRTCHAARVTVVGALVTLWCLADDYAEDSGLLPGYTCADIDALVEVPGFCLALPPDWMIIQDESLYLPGYKEHNGITAKSRSQAAERQRRHRSVTHVSRSERDKSVTREEKRREEKNINTNPPPPSEKIREPTKPKPGNVPFADAFLPPELDTPDFRALWVRWAKHRKEIRHPLTETMVAAELLDLAAKGIQRATAMIEHTIFKGWQGLREPESGSNGHTNGEPGESLTERVAKAFNAPRIT